MMDNEKILFNELESLVFKFIKMRDTETVGQKARAYSIVITLLEQALAYYAYFVMGMSYNPFDLNTKEKINET